MAEKLENQFGQINDPEVARQMAEKEAPYHKKTLGVFGPSEKKLAKGEKAAKELPHEEGLNISFDELPEIVKREYDQFKWQHEDARGPGHFRLSGVRKVLDRSGRITYRFFGSLDEHNDEGFTGSRQMAFECDMEEDNVVGKWKNTWGFSPKADQ